MKLIEGANYESACKRLGDRAKAYTNWLVATAVLLVVSAIVGSAAIWARSFWLMLVASGLLSAAMLTLTSAGVILEKHIGRDGQ